MKRHKDVILLVEDDRSAAELLTFLLRGEEYEVIHATDGETALHMARSRRPDVVLLDLELPLVDGRQFLLALHADPSIADIPVVIVTGSADVPLAGAVAVVHKPLVKARLLQVLDQVYRLAPPSSGEVAAAHVPVSTGNA